MTTEPCQMCGHPLPRRSWWQRVTGVMPHCGDRGTPEGDACFQRYRRLRGWAVERLRGDECGHVAPGQVCPGYEGDADDEYVPANCKHDQEASDGA